MDSSTEKSVAAAMAMARLRALRTGVVALHKAALDAERARYERAHGPIVGPQQALKLVLADPFFAWLRPLADFIVHADERMADREPVQAADVQSFAEHLRGLLQLKSAPGSEAFSDHYRRLLQDVPEVVVAHGHLIALLSNGG